MTALPTVTIEWELNANGRLRSPLDGWTLAEVEPLLDADHDEHDAAMDALRDETPRPRSENAEVDVDVRIDTDELRRYVDARRAAGLTDRILDLDGLVIYRIPSLTLASLAPEYRLLLKGADVVINRGGLVIKDRHGAGGRTAAPAEIAAAVRIEDVPS